MASGTSNTPNEFNPRGLLPSRFYPSLAIGAAITGALLPAVFGMGVYANPQLALDSLKIPTPSNEDDKEKIFAVFKFSAAREVAFGVTTMGIWWFSARRGNWSGYWTLGIALLAKGPMKLSDGFVIQDLVGQGRWVHWNFVVPDVLAGLALLGLI